MSQPVTKRSDQILLQLDQLREEQSKLAGQVDEVHRMLVELTEINERRKNRLIRTKQPFRFTPSTS